MKATGWRAVLLAAAVALGAPGLQAQSVPYRIDTMTDGLLSPASLAFLPDGRFLVAERGGRLRLVDAAGRLQPQALNSPPPDALNDLTGLIDVVLDPDFANTQRLFLTYQRGTQRANQLRLVTARLQGDQLGPLSTVFDALPARLGSSNFGGRLAFLPDKTLVISVGDGFDGREQAQNPRSHLGKLLRLNRDGSVPADNPFSHVSGSVDVWPAVYSLGHRNVQGLAFDPVTRRLLANEHGAKGGDEINLIQPGHNYGWPLATFGVDYTGARITPYTALPGLTAPLLHWTPSIAPSALAVYRGSAFPAWHGDLFTTTLAGQAVVRVRLDGARVVQQEKLFSDLDARLRDVKVGPDGLMYLLTDDKKGRLLRVRPGS